MFGTKRHNFLLARRFFKAKSPAWWVQIRPIVAAAAATLIFAAFALLTFVGVAGYAAYGHWQQAQTILQSARTGAQNLDWQAAFADIDKAADEFDAASRFLIRLEPLSSWPYVGPRVAAANRLLKAGRDATAAWRDISAAVRDIMTAAGEGESAAVAAGQILPDVSTVFRDLTPERKLKILASLQASAPRWQDAAARADAALVSIDAVLADTATAPFREELLSARPKIVAVRDWLQALVPVASVAPAVLGYPQMKRYLIFFQNNTELRPTGGFLGTYALVTLGAADIKYLTVKDVYFLDGPNEKLKRPEPPAPLKRYLGVKQWYLRDANWSPDFAVAAPIMEKFFHEESVTVFGADKVPAIDGVIAITPRLAQDLLRLVGPVTVQGKTFTADNLVDELELQVEKQFYFENIPFEQRKDIVGVLTAAVLERLMALPLDRLLSLVSTLQAELAEGHILLWVKDAGLERLIVDRDWGGVLKPVRGDYFSVIDANLASLKSDPAVSRTVEYAIRPETDRSFIGTVRVTYNHEGRFDWKTTRYRTYTRLYVPAGTQLLGVAGAMLDDKLKDPRRTPGQADTYDELGRRAFGAFISIEPGEKRTLEFRFRLAPAVAEAIRGGQYFLDVEKQPGTEAVGLTLDLDFGKKPLKSEPPVTVSGNSDGHYRYRGDLRVDRAFDINF